MNVLGQWRAAVRFTLGVLFIGTMRPLSYVRQEDGVPE
jgi:hypothetical protein